MASWSLDLRTQRSSYCEYFYAAIPSPRTSSYPFTPAQRIPGSGTVKPQELEDALPDPGLPSAVAYHIREKIQDGTWLDTLLEEKVRKEGEQVYDNKLERTAQELQDRRDHSQKRT